MISDALTLCLVTQQTQLSFQRFLDLVKQSIEGGVTSVQFRDKINPPLIVRNTVKQLQQILTPRNIPLIINDDVQLALDMNASGVHLGQSDLSPQQARTILGQGKIIGWSIETIDQLKLANQLNCIDYIAASAVFVSKSKQDCKTIWGLSGLEQLAAQSKHPVIAIGGINVSNARAIIKAGACGLAVISSIHDHSNPAVAAAQLIQEIEKGRQDVQQ